MQIRNRYNKKYANLVSNYINTYAEGADASVDLNFYLFKPTETTPYATGDYRVISTTEQLPAGTKITVEDYAQGNNVKAYYYYVTGTETETDGTRYLYKLSNFNYNFFKVFAICKCIITNFC